MRKNKLPLGLILFSGLLGIFANTSCNFSSSEVLPINVPNGVGALSTGSSKVELHWNPSTGSPEGYYLEQSSDGTNFTQIQVVPTTVAVVGGLSAGKNYYFRVRAYNKYGDSAYASMVSVAIP